METFHPFLRFSIAILLFVCCSFCSSDFLPDYDDDNPLPLERHERIRRYLRFISRKPGADAEPETGIGFRGHLMNVLNGGTLGIEFQIPHVDRFGRKYKNWRELVFGNEGIKDKDKKFLEVENPEENEIN